MLKVLTKPVSMSDQLFPLNTKVVLSATLLMLALLLIGCNGGGISLPSADDSASDEQSNAEADGSTVGAAESDGEAASSSEGEGAATESTDTDVSEEEPEPTEAAVEEPELEPTATPKPEPEPTPEPLFYNLPETTMQYASVLYASPNRDDPIIPVPVPEGEKVFIMGRNSTQTHVRVVWNTGVGWIPVSFTDYNGQQARLAALPIFEREPPACAIPVTTQFGLNSTWTSDQNQKIAVVVDLFRSKYGAFPQSALALVVNDFYIDGSRREIVEQGQFSLKDVVLSLPQNVQPDDVVGYQLDTDSDEPLTFMATIFSIPSNCQWDID